LRSSRR